jgi:hypothetical protein
MKLNFPKITLIAFVLNSLIITIAGIVAGWHYIDFSDPLWTKGMYNICLGQFIYSPFGFYQSDWLTITTSVLLLVLSILSLKYNKDTINELRGGFFIVLILFEIVKLLLAVAYSNGGSVVPF